MYIPGISGIVGYLGTERPPVHCYEVTSSNICAPSRHAPLVEIDRNGKTDTQKPFRKFTGRGFSKGAPR